MHRENQTLDQSDPKKPSQWPWSHSEDVKNVFFREIMLRVRKKSGLICVSSF